jgi:pimeloyl-ACP methyl ester carboxylesterase
VALAAEAPDLPVYGTRDEHVAAAVECIARQRVLLIGQSLGGHTAFLVAARHPELVSALVVIEASPDRDTEAPERVRAFFGRQPDPYGWGGVDAEKAAMTMSEIAERDWWDEWARVRCPVLVVRGERGWLPAEGADRMAAALPDARAVTIPGAGHDVHLDQPAALAAEIGRFAERVSS